MRVGFALALFLTSCGASVAERGWPACEWSTERTIPVSPPSAPFCLAIRPGDEYVATAGSCEWAAESTEEPGAGCHMVTAEPGAGVLLRLVGDESCGQSCLVIGPGDQYVAMVSANNNGASLNFQPVDCSAQCE
jgi:hypothetical protein